MMAARKALLPGLVAAFLVIGALAPSAAAATGWKSRLHDLVRGRRISVVVRFRGTQIYSHNPHARRPPASNQKLLLSMALLDRFGPSDRIRTDAAAFRVRNGVVTGNLWVLGRGDPTISSPGGFARNLWVKPSFVRRLARKLDLAGIRRVRGRVVGSTGYFAHDWWAPGWRDYYRTYQVGLPSALTYNGNMHRGHYTWTPERYMAKALTAALERRGIPVRRGPDAARAPDGLRSIAHIESAPLRALMRHMNHVSSNFFAEVLGKRLGGARFGRPGTIAKGARATRRWAAARGVEIDPYDSSGLSYASRATAAGIARLLAYAERQPWVDELKDTLPTGGRGTLEDRLGGIPIRAKTGTLIDVSALSGWVKLRRPGRWAAFSILSDGIPKWRAVPLEDRIVKLLHRRARVPAAGAAARSASAATHEIAMALPAIFRL